MLLYDRWRYGLVSIRLYEFEQIVFVYMSRYGYGSSMVRSSEHTSVRTELIKNEPHSNGTGTAWTDHYATAFFLI